MFQQDATGKLNDTPVTVFLLGEWGAADLRWWPVYNGGIFGGAISID